MISQVSTHHRLILLHQLYFSTSFTISHDEQATRNTHTKIQMLVVAPYTITQPWKGVGWGWFGYPSSVLALVVVTPSSTVRGLEDPSVKLFFKRDVMEQTWYNWCVCRWPFRRLSWLHHIDKVSGCFINYSPHFCFLSSLANRWKAVISSYCIDLADLYVATLSVYPTRHV